MFVANIKIGKSHLNIREGSDKSTLNLHFTFLYYGSLTLYSIIATFDPFEISCTCI